MLATLRHEEFYASGMWCDESQGVYLGWVLRRADLAARLPLWNETGDIALVFSGEEFSAPASPSALRAESQSRSSAALVHRYAAEPDFPAGLNGRFQGLVVDRARGRVLLFNDRFGLHRLYYHQSRDAFYFACEAKAILSVRPELRALDPRGLGEYISCGCVLENRTLFPGILALPPASAWQFRRGRLESQSTYFDPHVWEEQPPLPAADYSRELREVFSAILPRYFQGSEKIAMSLTGGLDGRMIMAWRRPQPGELPCFSFAGPYRDCQDAVRARRIAALCGQSHDIIRVGGDFLSNFAHYAERTIYLTDGCADVARSADLYINVLARRIAPVRMTGNYGGEILRAIRVLRPGRPQPGLYSPVLQPSLPYAADTCNRLLAASPVSFSAFYQCPWHHYGLLALEETQLTLRSPFLDNDLVRLAFRAPAAVLAGNDACLQLIAAGNPRLARLRSDRGIGGSPGGLWGALAWAWLEGTFKAEYVFDYGFPHWAARWDRSLRWLRPERLFLGRHKFCHYRAWYRGPLAAYVRDVLLSARALQRPWLQPAAVRDIVEGHTVGYRNHTLSIHKLLSLELIAQCFLDGRADEHVTSSAAALLPAGVGLN